MHAPDILQGLACTVILEGYPECVWMPIYATETEPLNAGPS